MARFLVLYLIGITALQAGVCLAQPDPCLPSHHITLVNQTFRSAGNNLSFNSMVGDGDFNNTWLRFDSPAGGDLITWCPPIGSCGTYFPVWMDGTVPTISEGVVTRTAHAHWFQGCKDRPANISVKNCGNFRVYQLPNTTGNGMGYCVGNETRCPPGQTSATGWSPGCYPIPPKLVGTQEPEDPGIGNVETIVIGTSGGLLLAISVAAIIYKKRRRKIRKPDQDPTYDGVDYDAMGGSLEMQTNVAYGPDTANRDTSLGQDNGAYRPGEIQDNPETDHQPRVHMTRNEAYEPQKPGVRNEAYVSNDKRPDSGSTDVRDDDQLHQNKYRGRPLPEPKTYAGLEKKGMDDRPYCAMSAQPGGVQ